jgi:hypothetical protein
MDLNWAWERYNQLPELNVKEQDNDKEVADEAGNNPIFSYLFVYFRTIRLLGTFCRICIVKVFLEILYVNFLELDTF